MADAAYYRAYYAVHKEERKLSARKYKLSDKGFAFREKMRMKYINDEEYRKKCLERSRIQVARNKAKRNEERNDHQTDQG